MKKYSVENWISFVLVMVAISSLPMTAAAQEGSDGDASPFIAGGVAAAGGIALYNLNKLTKAIQSKAAEIENGAAANKKFLTGIETEHTSLYSQALPRISDEEIRKADWVIKNHDYTRDQKIAVIEQLKKHLESTKPKVYEVLVEYEGRIRAGTVVEDPLKDLRTAAKEHDLILTDLFKLEELEKMSKPSAEEYLKAKELLARVEIVKGHPTTKRVVELERSISDTKNAIEAIEKSAKDLKPKTRLLKAARATSAGFIVLGTTAAIGELATGQNLTAEISDVLSKDKAQITVAHPSSAEARSSAQQLQ